MKSAIVAAGLGILSTALGQSGSIVGTWSSKSQKVITGPDFYNPVDDKFNEPSLPGISYSFTSDGYYEVAYYRAVSNPVNHKCVSAVMQWQHGTYSLESNGSIVLSPIEVDGRQQKSTPCQYDNSLYTRYYQPELLKSYSVVLDKYHNVQRLNLFMFNGAAMQPLYLVYNPPQMLPTQTLNPTASGPSATGKTKREQVVLGEEPDWQGARTRKKEREIEPDHVWWVGVGLVVVGSAMYMYPSKQ